MNNYINQNQYRGRRIDRIEVTARAQGNVALVDVVAGYSLGTLQFSNGFSQTQAIFANQGAVIGQQQLYLSTRGYMIVETVRIYLR